MKPPIDPSVDLRNFPFMPLDVVRLWDSELSLTASPEGFRAAVLLWCKAWHQVPAGSLPNDDRALARLAGCDRVTWEQCKADALHGFALADDGRLYHPVVVEKAKDAWAEKERYRKAARNRWKNKKKLDDASHGKRIEDASCEPDKTHMQLEKDIKERDTNVSPKKTSSGARKKGLADAKRGNRLPPDWQPSDTDRAFAEQEGCDPDRTADEFRDYWTAQPGQRGVKLDWPATWRNWCRKSYGRKRPPSPRPPSKTPGRSPNDDSWFMRAPKASDEQVEDHEKLLREWQEAEDRRAAEELQGKGKPSQSTGRSRDSNTDRREKSPSEGGTEDPSHRVHSVTGKAA